MRPPALAIRFALSSLAALIFLTLGFASGPASNYQFDADASTMTISGTSTLHDWTCQVEAVEGYLRTKQVPAEAASDVGLGELSAVSVKIPVQQIECGKDRMNGNLREALQANAYPTIIFQLQTASVAPLPDSAGAWFQVEAEGRLAVAGTWQPVRLDVRGQRLDDGRLRFVGETPLTMTSFDVDPPSFMLGAVKTGDEITVAFDVIAAPQS